jgi:hypothetical protein
MTFPDCQAGFVKHKAEFRRNGNKIAFDSEMGIVESQLKKAADQDCVEISSERISLGPGVHIWISCFRKDKAPDMLDEFQVFFPCEVGARNDTGMQWPSPDYTDLSMGDLARSLEQIFIDRNPDVSLKSKAALRLYGRWLSSVEKGVEIFRSTCQHDELYSERIEVFLDIKN